MASSDLQREYYHSKYLTISLADAVTLADAETVHAVVQIPENMELESVNFAGVAGAAADGITIRVRRGSISGAVLASVTHTAVGTGPEGTCGTRVKVPLSACETVVITGDLTAAGDDFTSLTITLVLEPLKTDS